MSENNITDSSDGGQSTPSSPIPATTNAPIIVESPEDENDDDE